MRKSLFKKIALATIALLIVIQFWGTKKNSSSVPSENAIEKHYTVPPKVLGLLKTSCYDCHSNNTVYPWYNNIQPVKWWLASHINDGKKHLNFDEFNAYSSDKMLHKLDEVAETVSKGEMPLNSYTLIHGNAKLSNNDRKEIEAWVNLVKQEIKSNSNGNE
ncbi:MULTISPECIES: heme-binding domain-containing protein [Sphingobacterium]|uniref:heme-binding domain-containing protein n=1 Tax=Sphingobacterium TaxID=28453 RepID=UPI0013DABF70|nr:MULTISPECIES: heme-binding domain-containing protein [unclassified Sphingobacterium]